MNKSLIARLGENYLNFDLKYFCRTCLFFQVLVVYYMTCFLYTDRVKRRNEREETNFLGQSDS